MRAVEAQDPMRNAEERRQPLRRRISGVEAANVAVPYDDVARFRAWNRIGQIDNAGGRRGQSEATVDNARLDQRETRLFALSDEFAVAIDDHPLTVADTARRKSRDVNVRAREVDAATALDGINVERADAGVVQFRSPAM